MNAPNRPAAPRRMSGGTSADVPEPAPSPRASAAPPRRTAVSWRAVVLIVVLVLALAVVLPSLRAYARQSDRLAELTAQVEAARREVAGLEAELARWDDPDYVVAQARARLFYVMPGDVAYRVVDPETVPADPEPAQIPDDVPIRDAVPWYVGLWDSLATPSPEPSTRSDAS